MTQFRVRPRYTDAEGGIVDQTTAERIAARERDTYLHWLSGNAGEERQRRARQEGLAGIVEVETNGDEMGAVRRDMLLTSRM